MFFKTGSIKISQYSHENICVGTSFLTFLKRDSNTVVSCGYCKTFVNGIFYRTPLVAAFDSPTILQQSQLGWLFFDFALPCAFDFNQKLAENFTQIIFYYRVTKQILCLNWLTTCFRFYNMFWKNITWFRFWWKT